MLNMTDSWDRSVSVPHRRLYGRDTEAEHQRPRKKPTKRIKRRPISTDGCLEPSKTLHWFFLGSFNSETAFDWLTDVPRCGPHGKQRPLAGWLYHCRWTLFFVYLLVLFCFMTFSLFLLEALWRTCCDCPTCVAPLGAQKGTCNLMLSVLLCKQKPPSLVMH